MVGQGSLLVALASVIPGLWLGKPLWPRRAHIWALTESSSVHRGVWDGGKADWGDGTFS